MKSSEEELADFPLAAVLFLATGLLVSLFEFWLFCLVARTGLFLPATTCSPVLAAAAVFDLVGAGLGLFLADVLLLGARLDVFDGGVGLVLADVLLLEARLDEDELDGGVGLFLADRLTAGLDPRLVLLLVLDRFPV